MCQKSELKVKHENLKCMAGNLSSLYTTILSDYIPYLECANLTHFQGFGMVASPGKHI